MPTNIIQQIFLSGDDNFAIDGVPCKIRLVGGFDKCKYGLDFGEA